MIEYENLRQLNLPFLKDLTGVFNEVFESGSLILGKQVIAFEKEFADYCKTEYCIGVGNGLDALTIALRSFSFKYGSEVIVPANTYMASILAILNSNLTPVLVEPDRATYNLDPNLVEEAITKRTAAIMPVHLYGKCCCIDEIKAIGTKYNLRIVEDCAQAHGAKYKGKMAGTFGDYGAYSFYPTKNLGALGDGGCLLTEDEDLKQRTMLLRNYGSIIKDINECIGFNSRLDELQAGFLRVKLKALNNMNDQRRRLANLYHGGISSDYIKPITHADYLDVYYVYNVRHPRRDEVREYLLKKGIETKVHYPVPPHRQNAFKGLFSRTNYPISEEIHDTTFSIPISPIHSEEEILEIIEVMNAF